MAIHLKLEFRVIFKYFIDNIVPKVGHKELLHPLQSILMYALVIDWKINLGFITFELCVPESLNCLTSTHTIQNLSPIWDGLIVIFRHFGVPLHNFKRTINKPISPPPSSLWNYSSSLTQFIPFCSQAQSSVSSNYRSSTDLPDFNPYSNEAHLLRDSRDPLNPFGPTYYLAWPNPLYRPPSTSTLPTSNSSPPKM